ncbi:Hypothetical predicted protein [Cloeon dipterum]|uniref:Acid phosphatase n=1 Tax=Cloeon dipterum TaxID=197152 RepID=A0A8S1CAJ4_9INSE|nr:Hypothetical predicted protein [Cloeon dipterum]
MPPPVDFMRKNRVKLAFLAFVIVVVLTLTLFSTSWSHDHDQEEARVVLQESLNEQIRAANRTSGNSTVVFASVIFRHGDRNPTNGYKTDPYKNGSEYVGGFGALTMKGKKRMYLLGKYLRKRYQSLIPPLYQFEDIYVLSSDADRCIMSVEVLLNALYPPLPFEKIHPSLDWQPIPIHTVPRDLDKVVSAKAPCPKYTEALQCVYNSSYSVKINTDNHELLEMLTLKSGQSVENYAQAESLYNTLALQKELGLTLPEWATDEVLERMKQLAIDSLAAFTHTKFMRKIRGGPLLAELRDRLNQKRAASSRLKMLLVSGHDLTLINLLRTLGFVETRWKPDFSATLILELHAIDQKHIVQLWYNNGFAKESTFEQLQLPGCDLDCTLNAFLEATQDVTPLTWTQDCTTGPTDPDACS